MDFLNLNALNIRSGLELEVSVENIFKIKTDSEGNIKAKEFFLSKNKDSNLILKDLDSDGFMIFDDVKTKKELNPTLDCYLYNSYVVYLKEFNQNSKEYDLGVHKNFELLFVNKEQLSLDEFCENFMEAQSYSGNFQKPEIAYPFIGCGNFDLIEYAKFHELVSYSNVNLINFYIFHHNMLASVGHFVGGLFEHDIEQQKKYITTEEEKYLKNLAESQKSITLFNMDNS